MALEAMTMAARLYDQQRWTQEEDDLLRSMSAAGKSLTLMTAKLKRPMNHIKARAHDLGVGIRGTEISMRPRRKPSAVGSQ